MELYSSSLADRANRATNPPRKSAASAARARLGRSLCQLELPLLQFSTEHGQMLGVAIACGRFLAVFHTVHFSFRTEKWLYLVARIEAGETVDSKNRQ